MSTITPAQQAAIAAYLAGRHIPAGVGSLESACSIAAINLALTGRLTDEIPACMSLVVGRWIIVIQDAMPDAMRNGEPWRALLPRAAGTGRAHEAQRLAIILDWMWRTVLPQLQAMADAGGYGAEWARMCSERTEAAARAAAWAAEAAGAAWAAWAAWAAAGAARAAARAAWAAAEAAARAANQQAFWLAVDPPALLARLVAVSDAEGRE
jgi:hypothetical protein